MRNTFCRSAHAICRHTVGGCTHAHSGWTRAGISVDARRHRPFTRCQRQQHGRYVEETRQAPPTEARWRHPRRVCTACMGLPHVSHEISSLETSFLFLLKKLIQQFVVVHGLALHGTSLGPLKTHQSASKLDRLIIGRGFCVARSSTAEPLVNKTADSMAIKGCGGWNGDSISVRRR